MLTTVRDRTAIIEISGLIFPYKIQRLNLDLQAALNNPSIDNIILNVDSGGGYVAGVHEFANSLAESTKPVMAYVKGIGASAAYWIAAAADEIILDATAMVGSIGVVATFFDWKGYDEKIGLKEIEIVNSDSPLKRVDVTTDEGKQIIQKQLDDLAAVFFGDIANFKGISTDDVAAWKGNTFVGEESVKAGLADSTGSLEGLLTMLNGEESMSNTTAVQPKEITKAYLQEHCKAVFDEILADGVTQGAKTAAENERARIAALDSINVHGSEAAKAIVKAAKEDGEKTAESVALEVLGAIETPNPKGGTSEEDIQADSPDGVGSNAEGDGDDKELAALVSGAVAQTNQRRGAK